MQNNYLELQKKIQSKVLYDDMSLAIYATDASLYQIVPDAVVIVEREEDLKIILEFSKQYGYKILARGGATSLAGQTVAKAIVLDFSKYMTEIISFDEDQKTVTVQAGVIHAELNQYLQRYNLHFAPDPATSNRATIGGMIANNSSGAKSILYGKTSDYVHSLKVMLSDGTTVLFDSKDELAYDIMTQQGNLEADIYNTVRKVVFENAEEIKKRFPKIMRRVSGYALDEFVGTDNWNLSRLITGSEGTLGIILEATLGLVPLPKEKGICLVHYTDRLEAIKSVSDIVEYGPSAVEMLDHNVLIRSKENAATIAQYSSVVLDEPEALLICEFFAQTKEELDKKILSFQGVIIQNKDVSTAPIYLDNDKMNDVWNLRKKGLGLLMGIPGDKKPLPFIEDSSIPLVHLADYIKKITDFCTSIDTKLVLYAHASVGVLHIRPYLDIREQEDIDRMKKISIFALGLVKEYGGSWSGEHGDGLVRSPKLPLFFGDKIMDCFKEIKSAFDPDYLLNPHKKTDALPMDSNLRYGLGYKDDSYDFVYKYRKERSFGDIVHLCSGISACRNKTTDAMCPSYRASLDEKNSPRGRANALRMVMSGQVDGHDLLSDELIDVLSLCLSCKACKSECPSNVDIAKLKSEVMQLRHDAGKTSYLQKMISGSPQIAKIIAGPMAPIANFFQKQGIVKNLLQRAVGIDERRHLPTYAKQSLINWYKRLEKHSNNEGKHIILFADTTINYNETHIGKAAYRLLVDCGYIVEIVDFGDAQRPRVSNGFLKEAKKHGAIVANKLRPYLEDGIPILVCEPGDESALIDDLPDLLDDEVLAQLMKDNIFLIDEYLLAARESGELKGEFVYDSDHIVVHTHCHQTALHGSDTGKSLCESESTTVDSENTGCCGMAGAFGYEKTNYNISKKVAEMNIVPKVKKMKENSLLIANGTSCRHQFNDMTGKEAKHWVEVVKYLRKTV